MYTIYVLCILVYVYVYIYIYMYILMFVYAYTVVIYVAYAKCFHSQLVDHPKNLKVCLKQVPKGRSVPVKDH